MPPVSRRQIRMKALVLIGGFGTRLRPITYTVPKQLVPIAGKPMLYHVLDLLPPEVDEAVFATGYLQQAIADYVARHPTRLKIHCVPEATPLGTGGGMRNAGNDLSDPFVLLNSDVISQIDVAGLIAFHRAHGGLGTMTLTEVEDTRPYGVAALGARDRIERFVEKPAPEHAPSHWINAGVQVWRPAVIERIPPGRPVSFETEVVPGLLAEGVYGFRSRGFWEDAGTPERLLHSQRLLFDGGRAVIGTAPVGATVTGPVASSDGVQARGAHVGPYVHLGSNVSIGSGARIEDSVIMDGAEIGRGAHLKRCLVGPGWHVPEGARIEGQVLGTAPPA